MEKKPTLVFYRYYAFNISVLFIFLLLTLYLQAQQLELFSNSATLGNGPNSSGPMTATFRSNTGVSATTTTYTPLTQVTLNITNQQYTSASPNGGTYPGITSGSSSANNNTAGLDSDPIFNRMDFLGSPVNSYFSSAPTPNSGNFNVAGNYGFHLFLDAYYQRGNLLTARNYYGDVTISFNRPVVNPVIHLSGMGGLYINSINDEVQGFYTEFELSTGNVNAGYTLTRLSGSTYFQLDATNTKVINTNTNRYTRANSSNYANTGAGASAGSVRVNSGGTAITSISFRVYLRGSGGSSSAAIWGHPSSSVGRTGDGSLISVSLGQYSLSGNIYNDVDGIANGLNGNNINGTSVSQSTGTNIPIYASLVQNGATILTVPVTASGTYSFTGIATGSYNIVLTTSATGSTAATLPVGWQSTGENLGTGTGNDGNNNGILPVVISSANVTNANFGIQRPPTAVNDISNNNPYGSPVTLNVLTNDSDPTPGNLNATTVSMIAPGTATSVQTDANGDVIGMTIPNQGRWTVNPTTGAITFIPQTGFTGNPTPIQYTVDDNAGVPSNPATITITYLAPVQVSGAVYIDITGPANIDGTLTNGQGLYVNVLNASNEVVYSARVGTNCSGQSVTGQFCVPAGTLVSGSYNFQLSKNQGTIGQPAPVKSLNTNWFTVGESMGSTGNDGSHNGILPITVGATNITGLRFGITASSDILLPVKLEYVKAVQQNNKVSLQWATTSEQNNKGFEIERSKDGTNWSNIGSVASQANNGNSSVTLHYHFTDKQPVAGKNRYRLLQTDIDGKITYSEVVYLDMVTTHTIITFPNPATHTVTLKGLNGSGRIILNNQAGQQVMTTNITTNICTLSIQQLPTGIYFITVTDITGATLTMQKLVKK